MTARLCVGLSSRRFASANGLQARRGFGLDLVISETAGLGGSSTPVVGKRESPVFVQNSTARSGIGEPMPLLLLLLPLLWTPVLAVTGDPRATTAAPIRRFYRTDRPIQTEYG